MKLTKTPDGYVVQVPDDVVAALGLHDGDEVQLDRLRTATVREGRKDALTDQIRRLALPFPAEFRFDREEANSR